MVAPSGPTRCRIEIAATVHWSRESGFPLLTGRVNRWNAGLINRSGDWLRQADADLRHAELSAREGDCEWACFAAQQAAEKAVKALYLHLHGDPWGHSLPALIKALPDPISESMDPGLQDSARALDKQYIPARDPNGFAQGAPLDYFTENDAREAISHATSILEFGRSQIRRS